MTTRTTKKKDRRMVKFADMADVRAKKKALTHIVNQWAALVEQAQS